MRKSHGMMSYVQNLLGHAAWADAIFLRAWAKANREDTELRERMSHAAGTHRLFLDTFLGTSEIAWDRILRGELPPPWAGQPLRTYDEVRAFTRENHARTVAFLGPLSEEDLARPVTVPWIGEPPCVIPVSEALVQVALHTQHHRGQNLHRLREIGGQPKNVDYILWLWKGRPAPIWD